MNHAPQRRSQRKRKTTVTRKGWRRSKPHIKPITCPYCGGQALLRPAKEIKRQPTYEYLWVCVRFPECDSFVSAHDGSKRPMGTLANRRLRRKRHEAHKHFDMLWQIGIFHNRRDAYFWLRDVIGIPYGFLHIGKMDEGFCDKVIRESQKVMRNYSEQKCNDNRI